MPDCRRLAQALLSLILLTAAHATMAGEYSTVINGRSFHLGSTANWNENNLGLGLEYAFERRGRWRPVLMVNGFQDSDENMSYMAGGGLHRNLYSNTRFHGIYVDLGLNAFLMTRDDVNRGRPFPGVLPSLTVGNDYAGINLTYLPSMAVERMTSSRMVDKSIHGIVFVQFKMNVGRLFGN